MSSTVLSPDSPAWLAAVRFHGHACPGLAIGCRMAPGRRPGVRPRRLFSYPHGRRLPPHSFPDEEVVCVAETDACCVDAVQLLLGCTLGKGNLLLRPRGKTAMSFYHRPRGSPSAYSGRPISMPRTAGKCPAVKKWPISSPARRMHCSQCAPFPSRRLPARWFPAPWPVRTAAK